MYYYVLDTLFFLNVLVFKKNVTTYIILVYRKFYTNVTLSHSYFSITPWQKSILQFFEHNNY